MRGYIYELTTASETDEETGFSVVEEYRSTTEDDFTFNDGFAGECESVQKVESRESCIRGLIEFLKQFGCIADKEIIINGGDKDEAFFVIVTRDAKLNYWRTRYNEFKRLAENLTLEEMAGLTDNSTSVSMLKSYLEESYADIVCEGYGGNWTTLDDWMRSAEENTKYYIGTILSMR